MFIIDTRTFAANMRYYREKQSYSIKDVADRSHLTYVSVASLEDGVTVPNGQQLERVARVLGVMPELLVLPRTPEPDFDEWC